MGRKPKWVKVPPDLEWLVERLTQLNPNERKAVVHHANKIYGWWLSLHGSNRDTGCRIAGKTRLRAKSVSAPRGAKNDLLRLRTAAKSGSAKIFQKAWLAVSGKTRRLVWKPTPPPIAALTFDKETGKQVGHARATFDTSNLTQIEVRGLHVVMPTVAMALPLIETAIRKLYETPAALRRKRNDPRALDRKQDDPDYFVTEFVSAACAAHLDLTGAKGIAWDAYAEKYKGGMIDLGMDIEARFGTKLFTVDRMRKNSDPA